MHYSRLLFLLLPALVFSSCSQDLANVTSSKKDGAYIIDIDGQPAVSYQFETYPAPEGVDSAYARSGFIHPLMTLRGDTLTDIQPKDHYHHYGIWNPWTHVLFEGDTLDFWNLVKREGTVRFAGFEDETTNGFSALHEHVVLKDGKNKVAMREVQTVKVVPISETQYALDFTLEYMPLESPFKILEYRYGGFGIRATDKWNGKNSEIITSEVSTRDEVDGTLGRWCLVQGELGNHAGGFLVMSHPDNFNHPEPLRVWPEANHEGLIFVNVAPTKNTDWTMEAGQQYTLKYRMVVSSDLISRTRADSLWSTWANQ